MKVSPSRCFSRSSFFPKNLAITRLWCDCCGCRQGFTHACFSESCVFQTRIAVVERDTAIESFADLNSRASEAEAARLWRDLQTPSVPLHHVVVADDAVMREAADALEIFRSAAPGFGGLA